MDTCIVHYDTTDTSDNLIAVTKETHGRLLEAKQSRIDLGGENLHQLQSDGIPDTYLESDNNRYHRKCYKKYTLAINMSRKRKTTSTSIESSRPIRTGDLGSTLFPDYCMICKKDTAIYVNKVKQFPRAIITDTADRSIREAAALHEDQAMIAAVHGVTSLHASEFKVHDKCHKDYTRICSSKSKKKKESSSTSTDQNSESEKYTKGNPDKLFSFVQNHIIDGAQCISTVTLTDIYGCNGNDTRYRSYVKGILEKRFGTNIVFITLERNEPQIVSKAVSHTTADAFFENSKEKVLSYASCILRENIDSFLESENQKKHPWPPIVESLSSTEESYPESLKSFLTNLLKNKKHSPTDTVIRHVNSFTQDIIHSISNGKCLTLKHTLVGCGIHSMTGLRKPIDILSAFGHSCTYDKVREIQTAQAELAHHLISTQLPLPLIPKDETCIAPVHFWWDNFDASKETKEGSIHTCHGVAYNEETNETIKQDSSIKITKSKRRSLSIKKLELPKRNIIPHKEPPLFPNTAERNHDETYSDSMLLIWKLQRLINSGVLTQTVSYRYVGWISSICQKNDSTKTHVTFLPAIRNPITEYSTVIECIYQSQRYAESCNMKYVHITTDVGAACKFYQVIWNNLEEFAKVLIHLGDFHGMTEYFGIVGKIMLGSGFEDIIYEADLCTLGGIKGVVSGKHYNRAWTIHECLSEAVHSLFIESEPELSNFSSEFISFLKNIDNETKCKDIMKHAEFQKFVQNYDRLKNEYICGAKGQTARYWMLYLTLIELQHKFHYAINVNNFGLRLSCWKELVDLCFATNKQNYARYGAFYCQQMESLSVTHPGALEEFCKLGVSVRRNTIGIGQSIDVAGEQTFMRSAKTTGGVKNFTTQDGTYEKWILTRPFQAKYVDKLLELVEINLKDNTRKCVRKSDIIKAENKVIKMKSVLSDIFTNPFSNQLEKDKLYNLASGCPTSNDVAQCLLLVKQHGKKLHSEFDLRLSNVSAESQRKVLYFSTIKRVEWKDFSSKDKKKSGIYSWQNIGSCCTA